MNTKITTSLLIVLMTSRAMAQDLAIAPLDPKTQFETVQPIKLEKDFLGAIVSARSNARYTAAGFNWPWKNVLTLQSSESKTIGNFITKPYLFTFNPRWMLDGSIMFQYGRNDSSYASYSLAQWNGKDSKAQTLLKDLNWKIVQQSPSGRYLAFIRGGQLSMGESKQTPVSLCTLDMITKEEKVISSGEPFLNFFEWGANDSLFYSVALNQNEQKITDSAQEIVNPNVWHTNIYEAKPAVGTTKIILHNAMRPYPSTNGKWLVSLQKKNPVKAEKTSRIVPDPTLPQTSSNQSFFLALSRTDGSELHIIRDRIRESPVIIWYPDNKGFALCETQWSGEKMGKAVLTVNISRFELNEFKLTKIGSFQYYAPPGTEISEDEKLWRPISVTRDHHFLISELTQFEEIPNNGLMLQKFDLQTGVTYIAARISSVYGLDWRED